MPLSEHEQKILDEIERRLAAEDPKFARSTTAKVPPSAAGRRLKRGIVGFVAGLAILIGGLVTGLDNANMLIAFGLVSFAVMLTSVLFMVRAWKELGASFGRAKGPSGWFERMEKRWRERTDDGDDAST